VKFVLKSDKEDKELEQPMTGVTSKEHFNVTN